MSGTNSADRILAILDVFTEERLEWTPDELMAELGYSRPTLYRYIKSLKEAGFLASMPGGCMTLGPRVVEMDYLMQKSDRLVCLGEPYLKQLCDDHPASSLLVRWYGSKLLCVASECSTPNALSSYPRGRPMPLARGAISRAIMAYLPRRQLEPMIAENLTEFASIGLGSTSDEVMICMKQIRRQGVAIAYGEVTPGVVGIAAPIFSDSNAPIAALCVTIEARETDEKRLERISDQVRAAAANISAELGKYPNQTLEEKPFRRQA